jgi:4-carboxymuconolactone decarboxylase
MIFSALKDFYAGADKCLKVHMAAAARAGASEDEILDAVFIAAIIGQTKVLASALRTFQEFESGSKEK